MITIRSDRIMFHETEHNVLILENGKIAYAVYLNEAGDLENVWFGKALSDIKATTRTKLIVLTEEK